MKKVLILMSTYNGGAKIKNQIKSILNQKDVDIFVYIRDDGSCSDTKNVLKSVVKEYPDKVSVTFGKNIGWKQSFLNLIYTATDIYDYYGFSDQDDIWFDNKVINCIYVTDQDDYDGPKLIHCNSLSVTSDLKPREEQENRVAIPPSFKAAIATEYFQGCGMLWNNKLMKLIQLYRLTDKYIAHDYWVGLIAYLFGKIYFVEENLFYHIRYENNSSEDGNRNKGRMKRVKDLITGKRTYMNPAQDLLNGYAVKLSDQQKCFLEKIVDYKINCLHKKDILLDRDFKRPSKSATLMLKTAILFNRY